MNRSKGLTTMKDDCSRIPFESGGMPTGQEVEAVIQTISDAVQVIHDAGLICDHLANGLSGGFLEGDAHTLASMMRIMSRALKPPTGGIAETLDRSEFVLRRLKPFDI